MFSEDSCNSSTYKKESSNLFIPSRMIMSRHVLLMSGGGAATHTMDVNNLVVLCGLGFLLLS